MSNRIKMVVFDMAGTTIDEQNVVYKTLQKALNKHNANVNLNTVLEFGAGKEKHQALKDILTHLGLEKSINSKLIFEDFKIMLDNAYETLNVLPIDGVEDLVLQLRFKNVIVVLNTGYNNKIANLLLKKINWAKGIHFDALIASDDVENGRPNPDMIEKAMTAFQIKDASLVLKAGDSVIDIEEGKNANCGVTVGVLSGAQTREQIASAHPTYILDSLSKLLELDLF